MIFINRKPHENLSFRQKNGIIISNSKKNFRIISFFYYMEGTIMENRSEEITIFRVKDEGEPKIKVIKASSTENDIRFYLNDTHYIKATNGGDKVIVEWDEDEIPKETTEEKKSFLEDIKANKKIFLQSVGIALLIVFVVTLMQVVISALIGNSIASSLCFLLVWPICLVLLIGGMEYKTTPQSAKSKHSAEHMMCNFLEKNCRLPKNFQEIKSTSRFNKNCGSRKKTIAITEATIANIVSFIGTGIVLAIVLTVIFHNTENINDIAFIVISIVTFFIVYAINLKLAEKGLYNFIVNPIQLGLNYFMQCCNTTKKVKDIDILLAFYAAKVWVSIVYPEFYSDEELYCEEDESENA